MPKPFSLPRIVELDHLTLLRAKGPDAASFLHGQLTSEVQGLCESRLAAYCTAQGRVLTVFLVIPARGDYWLRLRAPLADAILKRLRMYVLRAKVEVSLATHLVGLGVEGASAEALLAAVGVPVPEAAQGVRETAEDIIVRRPGAVPRFEIWAPPDRLATLRTHLGAEVLPQSYWIGRELHAGIPEITPATSEQFVPQMLNLDALGGISLSKGCYPGQEIVARTHYLGKLKQRMYWGTVGSTVTPVPGMALYAPNFPDQTVGQIVESCDTENGFELLAVMQIESARLGEVHLAEPCGPAIQLGSLPYLTPGPSG